jgi:tetratricopeptide (TPR) repeat protein
VWRSAPVHPRVWFILALAMIGLGTLAVILDRPAATDRVVILASPLNDRDRDVGPGMETLLSDCLEVLTGATVIHAPVLPSPAILHRLPPDTRLLRFQGGREENRLALTLEWNTIAGILSDQPWIQEPIPREEPRKALEHAIQHWPLVIRHRRLERLIPKSSPNFWLLLEGLSIHEDQTATEHLVASQKLAEEEPDCATAWTVLGDHLYRSLWVNPDQAGVGLNSRTHHAFQKVEKLIPGHPRATFLWSMMLTDTGNQSLALKLLENAIRLRPGTPDLYLGIAYAGRTSGLLEGARRALARRSELIGPMASPSSWFAETTYLYLGDQEAFGQELARAGELRQDANILFYKGYFALLQGDRGRALGFMVSGSNRGMEPSPFRDLCRVYRAYLEGRPEDGLFELRAIDEIRGKLRIPDGEWTFKEAEAYSLLGDRDRGMDCATRAFVQGFSCAAWYEASPFLAKVREHPRWPMLRRNIRERQAVLAGSFPPSAFLP